MSTSVLEKKRAEAVAARDKANALGAELRELEEKESLASDAERVAKEQAELDRIKQEHEAREAKRLAVLKAEADELDAGVRKLWPLIVKLRKEQNIPYELHQVAREIYSPLKRFYGGESD